MSRRARSETRQLIIDTGIRLLMERGLRGGCDHVGMADVLAEIERTTGQRITNASVYGRIWGSQPDFHRDLLMEAAAYFPSGEEQATRAAADALLTDADLTTAESRAAVLAEFCRVGGAAHLEMMGASRAWQTWLAIWAITVSTPEIDDDLERGPSIARRHDLAVREFAQVLHEVLPRVRHAIRPEFTLEQLAMAVYALSEGLVLHQHFAAEDVVTVTLPTGADQSPQQWTLFSVSLQALLTRFVQPV